MSKIVKSKAEGKTWLRSQIAMAKEIVEATPVALVVESTPAAPKTVAMWVEEILPRIKLQLRPRTFADYSRYMTEQISDELGDIPLKELRRKSISNFYTNLAEEGYGIPTIQYIHRVLHRILELAILDEEEDFDANPAHLALVPKEENLREMKILNEQQVLVLLAAVKGHPLEPLFHLAVKLGLRQAELLGLRWRDINFFDGVINVQFQAKRVTGDGLKLRKLKTKASRRAISMGSYLETLLRQHKIHQDEWKEAKRKEAEEQNKPFRWEENDLIFPTGVGTLIDQSNLVAEFKAILDVLDLPEIRFHDLRHTAASIMLKYTKNYLIVSRTLGHSKPSTTLNIYAHLLPGMESDAAMLIDKQLTPLPSNGFPIEEIGWAVKAERDRKTSLGWARKKPEARE